MYHSKLLKYNLSEKYFQMFGYHHCNANIIYKFSI